MHAAASSAAAVSPPPLPPAASASASPLPPAASGYYDEGSSSSTSRSISTSWTPDAQSVVQEGYQYATSGSSQHVTVVGHTDTSGGFAYNMRLSERRAKATADQLAGDKACSRSWTSAGRAKVEPAVQTGPGVKEPLNRRAVITVQF